MLLKAVLKKTFKVVGSLFAVSIVFALLLETNSVQQFLQNRFHGRIERSLSRVLGRSVNSGNLSFTILSGLGFNFENVSIAEAPGFGGEPLLYAESIHFVLSWHSFLSGHIELSRMTLTRASINVVHNSLGRWNFETFFGQTDGKSISLSGTPGQSSGGLPQPLPFKVYLDTTRVNFKDLQNSDEKKVFFLSEVSGKIEPAWFSNGIDFDLRFKPSRTDIPMENSGLLRVNGSLGPFRSGVLWPAVIQCQARMEKFPYSDAVALLVGKRTSLHGTLKGRLSLLGQLNGRIHAGGQIDLIDLHSLAVVPREQFRSASLSFSQAGVEIGKGFTLPAGMLSVGGSQLKLSGRFGPWEDPQLDFKVTAEKFHLDDAVDFVRGFTGRISESTHLLGDSKVECQVTGPWLDPGMTGQAEATPGQIQSGYLASPIAYVPFTVSYEEGVLSWKSFEIVEKENRLIQINGIFRNLWGARAVSVEANGRGASVQKIENVARSFGLWPTPASMDGTADFSLQWASEKKDRDAPLIVGWVTARDLTIKAGSTENIRIAGVKLESKNNASQLIANKMTWGRSVASASLQFTGVDFHQAQITVNANFLDVSELIRLGQEAKHYLGAETAQQNPGLETVSGPDRQGYHWTGKLAATWLYFKQLQVTNVRSGFKLDPHSLHLIDYSLDAYSGRSQGRLSLDWEKGRLGLNVNGHAENVKLESLVNLLTPLGPAVKGTATGEYEISGKKEDNQPWGKTLTAHAHVVAHDVKNVSLAVPAPVREIQKRLMEGGAPVAKESPFSLSVDLDYSPEGSKVNEARLTHGELTGAFTGASSKGLDLNLSGTVEKSSDKKGTSASAVSVSIRGPLDHASMTITSPVNPH